MSSYRRKSSELSGVSFIRASIPFRRTPLLWPNYLPNAAPPNTFTLGIRISTYEFRGIQRQSITVGDAVSLVWTLGF